MNQRQTLYETKYLHRKEIDGHWVYVTRANASAVVCIAALTVDDEILFVEQYRPPVDRVVLELPAGLAGDIAGQEDEPLLVGAQRELLEETGYTADRWTEVMASPTSAGLTDETVHFFVAVEAQQVAAGGGDESESIVVHRVPRSDVDDWLDTQIARGIQLDARLHTGLYLLDRALRSQG